MKYGEPVVIFRHVGPPGCLARAAALARAWLVRVLKWALVAGVGYLARVVTE